MNENVKGFFRRQSQKAGQTYGHQEKTVDAVISDQVAKFECMKNVNDRLNAAMITFMKNMQATTDSLKEVRSALGVLQTVEKDAFVDEVRQLDIAYNEIIAKLANIEKGVRESAESPILRVRDEYAGIKANLEDRQAKLLEYDFFRNKVRDLKAAPPKDPERLPRNEAILAKWQGDYEAQNLKTKEAIATCLEHGRGAQRSALGAFFTAYNTYLSEAVSTTRIVLRDIGGTVSTAKAAVLNVVTAASAQYSSIAGAISQQAAAIPMPKGPSAEPPPQRRTSTGGPTTPAYNPDAVTVTVGPPATPPAPAQEKDPFAFH